ncbi:hypothetical protein G6F45_014098 [Rhizopus arrhizus]|nr:hypothetical protein G6F45_014098 [Rhizopus arrhizus]
MADPYNSGIPSPPALRFDDSLVTTAFELPGYRVARNLGVVRGITVRSRSIVGNFLGGIQTLFGGNITIYPELCEQAREEPTATWSSTHGNWAPMRSSACATTPPM